MKPKNKLVELDQALGIQSEFHCTTNEPRALHNTSTGATAASHPFDRLTLSSTNLTPGDNYKRFAVGLVTPHGIQLSPLNAVFQLRADFDSTTATLAQQSASLHDNNDDDEHDVSLQKQCSASTDDMTTDDEPAEKNVNELVTMKFWRPEGRLQREKKLRSYNYVERARKEERWIDLAYYSPNEPQAGELFTRWMRMDSIERNRLPIRWRKTVSIQDYFQLLFFDKTIHAAITVEAEKTKMDTSEVPEQKPLVVPPTKPKKKKKTEAKKASTARKSRVADGKSGRTSLHLASGRSKTRKSTDSAPTPTTEQQTTSTPLSSVSLPNTIIKQDPETIQNELLSFMKRRFGYRQYFKLSEINIGKPTRSPLSLTPESWLFFLAIKLELISSPPGHPLASGVTEASILRAAAEIGAIYVNKKVPLRSHPTPTHTHTPCLFSLAVAEKSQTRTGFHQRSAGRQVRYGKISHLSFVCSAMQLVGFTAASLRG